MIGNNGLSEAVMREIAVNLDAHELIKIPRAGRRPRSPRGHVRANLRRTGRRQVQHIGKLLVIYRPTGDAKIALPKSKKNPPDQP